MTARKPPDDYRERLIGVERDTKHLAIAFESFVAETRKGFAAIHTDLDKVVSAVTVNQKTDWRALAAWGALMVTIVVALVGGFGKMSLNLHEQRMASIENQEDLRQALMEEKLQHAITRIGK